MHKPDHDGGGPKFIVEVEGVEHSWGKPTITTEEIIQLGGWPASEGAILVDENGNERTLAAGEVIELKPGQRFGKRVRFKRGGRR
jgi:hypothetical protein